MLTRLRFERFRGFKSFDAKLEPITAFLGPNSSGKTTALQAIRVACELAQLALESEDSTARIKNEEGVAWIILAEGLILSDPGSILALVDWHAIFLDQVVSEVSIILDFEHTDPIQRLQLDIAGARNKQVKLGVKLLSSGALQEIEGISKTSPLKNKRLAEYIQRHAPLAVFVPPFYGAVRDEELRSKVVIDRLLGSGDQSRVVRNLVAGLDHDQFERLSRFLEDTLGARLTYRTSGDALQTESPLLVRFQDSNGDIELSAAGAGLVNLIALYASLSRWRLESQRRQVIFLLDEPEAHLHPRLQAESAAQIGRLITQDFKAQLLLATHSVDILNRLAEGGACLLRCDRTATPSVTSLESDAALFDDLAGWVDLSPYTAINFLASRRVLFCEGPTDKAILQRLASLYWRDRPGDLKRFQRWSIVELQSASKQPIAALLSQLLRNEAIRAQAREAIFHVAVVLDRDYERTPKLELTTRDNIQELAVVWSKHSLESLFLEPGLLAAWVRAAARKPEDLPNALPALIDAALLQANASQELNEEAVRQLAIHQLRQIPAGEGKDQRLAHALRDAQEAVRQDPATWQRGKDRARLILGALRGSLSPAHQGQLPTALPKLIAAADLNRLTSAALPPEVKALLDHMVAVEPSPPASTPATLLPR